MDGDGHSGIENPEVNRVEAGSFKSILSGLKYGNGRHDLVVHVSTSALYGHELPPRQYLQEIGLFHYDGMCPFHRDDCFFRILATLPPSYLPVGGQSNIHMLHMQFRSFAEKLPELYELRQKQDRILSELGLSAKGITIFAQPLKIPLDSSEIPLWVDEVKFSRLRELESQETAIQTDIENLRKYLPLIYGTGPVLEQAVIDSLQLLGLQAEHTVKGFTADVLARTPDGSKQFGFEVTGTNGPIKKDSNKLTQVMDFERIKENNEKTVLLANTHNGTPIAQRTGLDDFTQPVLDFLQHHPILLMTGWDLYRMVGKAVDGSGSKEAIVETIYRSSGRLDSTND